MKKPRKSREPIPTPEMPPLPGGKGVLNQDAQIAMQIRALVSALCDKMNEAKSLSLDVDFDIRPGPTPLGKFRGPPPVAKFVVVRCDVTKRQVL